MHSVAVCAFARRRGRFASCGSIPRSASAGPEHSRSRLARRRWPRRVSELSGVGWTEQRHYPTYPGDFEMRRTNARIPHRAALFGLLCAAGGLALLTAGCGKSADKGGRPTLKVAYLGLTCEAPIFVAQEKGFYE